MKTIIVTLLLLSKPLAAQIVASQFTGTVDAKVNACLAAAILTIPAVCDARGVTGTVLHEINVGNHNQAAVTLLVPKSGQWISTINDGASCIIKQFANTAIIGSNTGNPYGAGVSTQFAITTASNLNTGPAAMYCNEPAGTAIGGGSYVRISGVGFFNIGLAPMTSGAAFLADGWYDNSDADHILVFDGRNSAAILRGLCCSASLRSVTLDGLHTAKAPTLVFDNTASQYNEGVVLDRASVDHPAPGYPNIACIHVGSSWAWWDSISIRDLYTESNQTDTTTTHVQCDSAYTFRIDGWVDARLNPASTAYALQITNKAAPYVKTQVLVDNFVWASSGTSTNTINNVIDGVTVQSTNLGVNAGAGAVPHYTSKQ